MNQTKNKNLFNKDFTLVVMGQIISLFGNAILRFALPLYLLMETNSPALFGMVMASSFLPMIALTFVGGILADRVNKKNIMVWLDFATGVLIIVLLMLIDVVPLVPLLIVTLMLLFGINGTYQPAVQASIPLLATEENMMKAGAIVNQISALAGLVGPIIGGMLFYAFGIKLILLISIGCFFASAIMELFIKIPYEKRKTEMGIMAIAKSDLKESMTYVTKEKPLFVKIMWMVMLFNLVLSSLLMIGIPIIVVETLKMSEQMLGFAQGALALGALCGGILTAVFSKKLQLSKTSGLFLGASLCVVVMAVPLLLNLAK